jgi:hypothetical protein
MGDNWRLQFHPTHPRVRYALQKQTGKIYGFRIAIAALAEKKAF